MHSHIQKKSRNDKNEDGKDQTKTISDTIERKGFDLHMINEANNSQKIVNCLFILHF